MRRRLCVWLEHFLVLPVRWYALHIRAWHTLKSRRKRCGRADGLDFAVDDATWAAVVPERYRARVLCFACFDALAARGGVEYADVLERLWFAGEAASFEFRPVKRGDAS
jgi:hypothetical protein